MFCTSVWNSILSASAIGGTIPKNADKVASSGSTLYFSASDQNSSLSSWTLSGCSAATSLAWVKSSGR